MKNMTKLLKRELDKKWLSIVIILFLNTFLYGQSNCTFIDVIDDTTHGHSYEKYNETLDMEKVLNEEKSGFWGFIGLNYKRLCITFTSIIKNKDNSNIYEVKGFSTVMNKNKRNFKGTFTLISHYRLLEPSLDPLKEGDNEGFSTFSYILKEDEKLSATGVFEGEMLVLWYKDKGKQPDYSSLFDFGDPAGNYKFLGTWTSYRTKKSSVASWGKERIPCSDNFDIGASEFSPNPKYYKYGWEEFKHKYGK